MDFYRKKPVVVEAHQWHKAGDHPMVMPYPQIHDVLCRYCNRALSEHGWLETLEGGYIVCVGDWIIKGVRAELYPCKPDVFQKTYEAVTDTVEVNKPWPECEHYNQFKGCAINGQTPVDCGYHDLLCPNRKGSPCPLAKAHWDGVKAGYDRAYQEGLGFFDYVLNEVDILDS